MQAPKMKQATCSAVAAHQSEGARHSVPTAVHTSSMRRSCNSLPGAMPRPAAIGNNGMGASLHHIVLAF